MKDEVYTLKEIMNAARSLLPDEEDKQNYEYFRGVCELIGRLRLDYGGHGDGTYENAIVVARRLGGKLK